MINGDVTRLRQILVNLLGNAVKFTQTGEVVIEVKAKALDLVTTPESQPRAPRLEPSQKASSITHEIQFAVRDTGIGIPPDRMDRLFQPFTQVSAATTRQYGGTGLGLTISQRLCERMGGQLWVESEVGHGSTFYFTILATAEDPDQAAVKFSGDPDLTRKHLLILEGNDTRRLALAEQAEAWGLLPHGVASGAEAIAWIEQKQPVDVAVLDMTVLQREGLGFGEIFRQRRQSTHLPFVLLASLTQAAANSDFPSHTTLIHKPVKQSFFYQALVQSFKSIESQVLIRRKPTESPLQVGMPQSLNILLAEDNPVNQKVALRILERIGYKADVAATGIEVLNALQQTAYDIVFMDIQMPEMDGLEATRQICRRWRLCHRPWIIAMTANGMAQDRQICLDAGMNDYLSKPIRIKDVSQVLEKYQGDVNLGRHIASLHQSI